MSQNLDSFVDALQVLAERAESDAPAKSYRRPEVYEVGSLDAVQNGICGPHFDYNPPWEYCF